MKTLREHLQELSPEDVEQLAINLWVNVDGAIRSFHINRIVPILTNWDSFSQKVLKYLPNDVQRRLPEIVFSAGPYLGEPILHRYGVLFNGNIPLDVQSMLQYRYKSHVVSKLPNVKSQNQWNSYIKLLLLSDLLDKQSKKKISKRKFEDKLSECGLITRDVALLQRSFTRSRFIKENQKSQRLVLDVLAYENWLEVPHDERIKLHYQTVLPRDLRLIEKIADLQDEIHQWVRTDNLAGGLGNAVDQSKFEQHSIVESTKYNGESYFRLTPMGWFWCTGERPFLWNERRVLVSADFEVFIPHDDDPNSIDFLMRVGTLKNIGYLFAFDFVPSRENAKELLGFLKTRALGIPDIVEFELKRLAY